jgi:hypothetical protein
MATRSNSQPGGRGSRFQYKPLPVGDWIRCLSLEAGMEHDQLICTIQVVKLDASLSFEGTLLCLGKRQRHGDHSVRWLEHPSHKKPTRCLEAYAAESLNTPIVG